MSRTHTPYPPEYRRRMVELVRAGRGPEPLVREFGPCVQSIRNRMAQADRDEARREDGLTSDERHELTRLRRENQRLKEEREILGFSRGLGISLRDRLDPIQGFEFIEGWYNPHRRHSGLGYESPMRLE